MLTNTIEGLIERGEALLAVQNEECVLRAIQQQDTAVDFFLCESPRRSDSTGQTCRACASRRA